MNVDSGQTIGTARIGLTLAAGERIPIGDIVELAQYAERLGYESIWVPETWSTDAVSTLAVLARETERMRIASGVFNVFSRSPALIAQTAATLQELSAARFVLGLGTSGPIVVEHWHGAHFVKPLKRTRDAVAIVRLALSGSRVDYDRTDPALAGFRLGNPASPPPPIYIASLGPKNVRLTGEIADGWLPIFAARGLLGSLREELESGATAAGRDAADIDVAAYIPAAIGERGESLLRGQLAYYLGGMGEFYAGFVARLGLEAQAARIHTLWQNGDRKAALAAVDDRLLELCTLGTDRTTARSRLEDFRADGVALPIAAFPRGISPHEIADTLEALAP